MGPDLVEAVAREAREAYTLRDSSRCGGSGLTTDLESEEFAHPTPVWSLAIHSPNTQDKRVHWVEKCSLKFMSFLEPQNVNLFVNSIVQGVIR